MDPLGASALPARPASEWAKVLGGVLEGPDVVVEFACTLESGAPGGISFLANPSYRRAWAESAASVVLAGIGTESPAAYLGCVIRVANPYAAWAAVLSSGQRHVAWAIDRPTGVDPSVWFFIPEPSSEPTASSTQTWYWVRMGSDLFRPTQARRDGPRSRTSAACILGTELNWVPEPAWTAPWWAKPSSATDPSSTTSARLGTTCELERTASSRGRWAWRAQACSKISWSWEAKPESPAISLLVAVLGLAPKAAWQNPLHLVLKYLVVRLWMHANSAVSLQPKS
jgi:hypothetical protein